MWEVWRKRESLTKGAARHGGNLITLDPCPVCQVSQAAHWRCIRCTSRGHLLGHSVPTSPYCDDCLQELAQADPPTAPRYRWQAASFGWVRRVAPVEAACWVDEQAA